MKYWLLTAENKASAYEMSREFSSTVEGWDSSPSTITHNDVGAGDAALLWRRGRGGGVVALGTIASTTPVEPGTLQWPLTRLMETRDDGLVPPHVRVHISFRTLSFAAPVQTQALRGSGLDHVVKQARSATDGRKLVAVDVTDEQWSELIRLVGKAQAPDSMPTAWNIPPGGVVKRSELHDVYGGNPRLSVGASGRTPNAFLFLDHSNTGELTPRWDGPVLLAPGQSQWTDSISYDNLAALAHIRRGVPLRVFVAHHSECLYLGEFAIDSGSPVERWVDTGHRDIRLPYAQQPHMAGTHAPLFRLRQLSGVTISADHLAPFRDASRISLRLHPVGEQPAATAVRELLAMLESEPADRHIAR